MNHESINVSEVIRNILPDTLEKDLQENERICPTCKGLGLSKEDNIYGLKDDPNPAVKGILFPYKHQSFKFCPDCYNGVQRLCQYCGRPLPNQAVFECDCEEFKKHEAEKKALKYKETIYKAERVEWDSVDTLLYCDENGEYYDSDDKDYIREQLLQGFIDEPREKTPKVLWVTEAIDLSVNAANICEDACNDLHEDAYDNCDVEGLQKLVDEWCEKQHGTKTYYPSYTQYVMIPEDWFKGEKNEQD
ncbi:MAG: hypothetical protein AB9836_04865 [Aminipila sp.]